MTDAAPRPRIESLLEHAGWVSSLARSLARNPADADDLEQETWHAAMRSPPATTEHPKAWLHAVMLNVFHARHRSDTRRRDREQAAARADSTGDSTDVVERAETSQRLVGYVLELPEPFQRTILLHYFDELTPREIAERLGEPLETIRSRIKRGLAKLRERMEKEHGGDWVGALAPLLGWPVRAPDGRGPMSSPGRRLSLRWSAAALLAAGLVAAFLLVDRGAADRTAATSAAGAPSTPAPPESNPHTTGRHREEAASDATRGESSATSPAIAGTTGAPQITAARAVTTAVLTISTDDGSDPGRIEVRAVSLAAVQAKLEGAGVPIVAGSAVVRAELPLADEQGRRVAEWDFRIDHPQYLPLSQRLLVTPPNEGATAEVAVSLRLRRAAHVVGSVDFEPGDAGDRALLMAVDMETPTCSIFEFKEVAPRERVRVRVRPDHGMAFAAVAHDHVPQGAELRLARGEEKDVGVLVLDPGARVSGRVTGTHGGAVAGQTAELSVITRPSNMFSMQGNYLAWGHAGPMRYLAYPKVGADGSFSVGGLPAGPVRLSFERCFVPATSDFTRSPDLVFDAPTDSANVAFKGATVRVVLTKDGRPLSGAFVHVAPDRGGGGGRTGEDGSTEVLVMPGRRHKVHVGDEARLTSATVEVVPGEIGTRTEIALEAFDAPRPTPETTAVWTVTFRGAAEGCTGASLAIFDPARPNLKTSNNTRDGRPSDGGWRFDDLPPGRWRIRVRPGSDWYDPSGWFQSIDVERVFQAGQSTSDTLDTSVGGRLVIRTLDAEGAPVRRASCRVSDAKGNPLDVLFAWRDANATRVGHTNLSDLGPTELLDALPPGRYRVDCTRGGKNTTPLSQDVEIVAKTRTEVVFRFE